MDKIPGEKETHNSNISTAKMSIDNKEIDVAIKELQVNKSKFESIKNEVSK